MGIALDSLIVTALLVALLLLWQLESLLTPHLPQWAIHFLLAINASLLLWELWHRFYPRLEALIKGEQETVSVQAPPSLEKEWYIGQSDLEFFQNHMEGPKSFAGDWEIMLVKEIPGKIKYSAWRRTLQNGKTEYKTLTLSADATADEFMDFYLDNDNRPAWDTMIIDNNILEQGQFVNREIVYRWVRKFPFSFLSLREYIIGRRLFRVPPENLGECETLYDITKAMPGNLPAFNKAHDGRMVRIEEFYSMGRARTVECPWGSNKPACESLLLHHEQLKIPENLARFAVKHGMWTFVHKMSENLPAWVALRRQRCSPTDPDPESYGSTMRRKSSSTRGVGHTKSMSLSAVSESTTSVNTGPGKPIQSREASIRSVAAFAAASTLAVLMHKSASTSNLRSREPKETAASAAASAAAPVANGKSSGRPLGSRHNRYSRHVSGF